MDKLTGKIIDLIFEHSKENGWYDALILGLITLFVIAILLSSCFYFLKNLLANRRLRAQAESAVAKSKTENAKAGQAQSKELADLEKYEKTLVSKRKVLDTKMKEIRDILSENNFAVLKKIRDDLCDYYSNDYFPALLDFINHCQVLSVPKIQEQKTNGQIIPSLRTMDRFYRMTNHVNFLKKIGKSKPYLIDRDEYDQLFSSALSCSQSNRQAIDNINKIKYSMADHIRNG